MNLSVAMYCFCPFPVCPCRVCHAWQRHVWVAPLVLCLSKLSTRPKMIKRRLELVAEVLQMVWTPFSVLLLVRRGFPRMKGRLDLPFLCWLETGAPRPRAEARTRRPSALPSYNRAAPFDFDHLHLSLQLFLPRLKQEDCPTIR